MEPVDLEGIAAAILREAGQENDDAPDVGALVERLLGANGLVLVRGGLARDAVLEANGDGWAILARSALPDHRLRFVVCHELAEWWMSTRERYQGDDAEAAANYIAAALIAPPTAFRAALRHHGRDFRALAAAFVASETTMALRDAELHRLARVVVAPNLRVRGPESFVWPPERIIRVWALEGGPGLARTRLTDDPRRVVLDVDETG